MFNSDLEYCILSTYWTQTLAHFYEYSCCDLVKFYLLLFCQHAGSGQDFLCLLEVQSLNHWTARKVPRFSNFWSDVGVIWLIKCSHQLTFSEKLLFQLLVLKMFASCFYSNKQLLTIFAHLNVQLYFIVEIIGPLLNILKVMEWKLFH